MDTPVPVYVYAADPISQAGLTAQLRFRPEVRVLDSPAEISEVAAADEGVVAVVAAETADDRTLQELRALRQRGCRRTVLVLTTMDDTSLVTALETGVCAVLHRADATPLRLAGLAQRAAVGDATMSPDILGRLVKQVSRLRHQVLSPMGMTMSGLSNRETQVLKLVADGFGTHEIAQTLSYSERTVKNILHDVTSRLRLRNRSHAVAYAIREGLI
jgi:DNA-binding NarL/FixJ family response regulator